MMAMVPDRPATHERVLASLPEQERLSFDALVRGALAAGLDAHGALTWLTWAERTGLVCPEGEDEHGRKLHRVVPTD
jgi:hypothetical protein